MCRRMDRRIMLRLLIFAVLTTAVPVPEAPPPTSEAPPSTSVAPTPTSEAPTPKSEAEPSTSVAPTPTSEAPPPTSEATTPMSEAPQSTSVAPTPTSEAPPPTSEAPTSTSEAPLPMSEVPTSTYEAPPPTSEAPPPTSEAPTSTSEAPLPMSEAPTSTSEAPPPTSEAPPPTSVAPPSLGIGTSKGFIDAGKMLAASMNTSADPCEDFYDFACGGWLAANPIPADSSSITPFNILKDKVDNALRDLLSSPLDSSPSKAKQMVRSLYQACMDVEAIERAKGADLIQGIRIGKGKLTFGEPDFYQNEKKYTKQIKAYRQFAFETVSLIASDAGAEISKKKLLEDVWKVFELEKRLSCLNETIDRKIYTYELREFHRVFPLIDWPRYFNLSASSFRVYFDEDPTVDVTDLFYVQLLKELLNEADVRVVANYIFLAYVKTYNLELDSRYAEIEQRLHKVERGQEASRERFKKCVDAAQHLKYATSALYVEKHFNEDTCNHRPCTPSESELLNVLEDAKAATKTMIDEISAAFRDSIEGNDWMDNSTKKEALTKLGSVVRNIGYPDWILQDEKLDKFYKDLDILPTDSFAEGMAKVLQWELNFELASLLVPVDRSEFVANPAVVNAYYNPQHNSIFFPAGILQPPLFCHGCPLALNYGTLGAFVGHELTHGFDDNGNHFDGNGNVRNWWEPETKRKFDERSECFVKQYSAEHYEQVQLNVNGRRTLGDNIADNGGIKQAYQAYHKHLQTHGSDRTPLVEQLTNEQLFFNWCLNIKPEKLGAVLLTDPHSPPRTRAKLVLANQREFAEAYHCPVGSTMNPETRCAVW